MLLFAVLFTYLFSVLYADELVSRILYGQPADIKDFPYFAALEYCGAAIISDTWLVTAAECVNDYYSKSGSVWVGDDRDHEGNDIKNSRQYKYYNEVVIHPDYVSQSLDNNIALLKLAEPLDFGDTVQAVKLPQKRRELKMNDVYTVVGKDTNEYNENLMKMDVTILSTQECLSYFSLEERIRMYSYRQELQGTICTKRVTPYAHMPGICYADWGNPLVHNNRLVGIAIRLKDGSKDACWKTSISMFLKVKRYTEWIIYHRNIR